MKMAFLCAMHRVELTNNPTHAIYCWQDGFDTGQVLFDQQQWQEALPHLGCAFETSEIMMSTKAVDVKCACEIFTYSSVMLAMTFEKMQLVENAGEVYQMAVNRLQRETLLSPQEMPLIKAYLDYLKGLVHNPGVSADVGQLQMAVH